jgi:hypothetical protein
MISTYNQRKTSVKSIGHLTILCKVFNETNT